MTNSTRTLASTIRRSYLTCISAGILITLLCYVVLIEVNKRQSFLEWEGRLSSLIDGQLSTLRQEFVNDRYYAAALRARELFDRHRQDGVEVGFYRVDGTPIYESTRASGIKHLLSKQSAFTSGRLGEMAVVQRELRFAGEPLGSLFFAAPPAISAQRMLTTALFITLGVLLIVFIGISWFLESSFKRTLLVPIGKLTQSIPNIGSFINADRGTLDLPRNLGSRELNHVAETLGEMTERLKATLLQKKEAEIQSERNTAIAEMGRQVAHDIRSPLAALSLAVQVLELPEDQRILIRSAASRIQDIANNLSAQYNDAQSQIADTHVLSPQLMSVLVEGPISEKRLQLKPKQTLDLVQPNADSSYGMFAVVDSVEFKRVLSNIIDNALQAIADDGTVIVRVEGNPRTLCVSVEDNGPGIPAEILPKLMKKGATFSKHNGSGLGLYHAKQSMTRWNGRIALASTPDRGTTVALTLPRVTSPAWFLTEICLEEKRTIVILDDDPSIHQVWRNRLAEWSHLPNRRVKHFQQGGQLVEWINRESTSDTLFLMDYELLGQNETGLDLAEANRLEAQTVLVTSYFEDNRVRERCKRLGIRLIPKSLASSIPIRLSDSHSVPAREPINNSTSVSQAR